MLDNYEKLELAFNTFMSLLQDDVRLHLDGIAEINDKTTPFIATVNVNIGVQQKDDKRMKEYQPRLTKLLNSLPAQVMPIKKEQE